MPAPRLNARHRARPVRLASVCFGVVVGMFAATTSAVAPPPPPQPPPAEAAAEKGTQTPSPPEAQQPEAKAVLQPPASQPPADTKPVVADTPAEPVEPKPAVHMPELPKLDDPTAVQQRLDRLDLTIRGLQKLQDSELPEGISLPEIFEIDVLDPAAVTRRRGQLGELIAALETRISTLESEIASEQQAAAKAKKEAVPADAPAQPTDPSDPAQQREPGKTGKGSETGEAKPGDGKANADKQVKPDAKTDGHPKPGAKSDQTNPDAEPTSKPDGNAKPGANLDESTNRAGQPEAKVNPPGAVEAETHSDVPVSNPSTAPALALPGFDVGTTKLPVVEPPNLKQEELRVLRAELQVARGRLKVLMMPLEVRKDLSFRDQQRREAEHKAELAQVKLDEAELQRKEAEEERLDALRQAEEASSDKQRELAEARAATEGLRRDLADLNASLSTAEGAFHSGLARDDDPVKLLLTRIEKATAAPKGRDFSALYDELVQASNLTREQLASALHDAENNPPTPKHDIELPVVPDDEVLLAAERDRLVELLDKLEADADAYVERARDLAHLRLAEAFRQENAINRAMIRLLDYLPPEKYALVLGFGSEGIAQLRREVTHLGLAIRWYRIRQRKLPERIIESLRDTYTLLEVFTTTAQLVVLFAIALIVIRRRKSLFERLRANLVRVLRRAYLVRPLQAFLAALAHLTPGLTALLVLVVTWRRLSGLHEVAELQIIYEILFAYTLYRLCLTAAHRGVAWMIRRRVGPRSENFHTRLYRSLRLIGRTVLLVIVLLTTSRYVLGTGHLYRLVAGFAWLGSIPIALYLIRKWQDDIASGYLRFRDRGALADAVRSTRVHWYGFFVALAAVVILLLVGSWRLVQGFILGFDQSRRALAFFFRRRLERHASEVSSVGMVNELPSDLVSALRLDATSDARLVVDHFPQLEAFHRQFDDWKASHDIIGAVLVVGDAGYGKTSWLKAATLALEYKPFDVVKLDRRLLSQRQVLQCLARGLEAPEEAANTLVSLSNWLRAGPRRLIMLDDTHLLYLRGVGTFQAWSLLMDLIERTGTHVYWVCTMGKHPYDYLTWARRGQEVFRSTIHLGAWSEQDIAALIHQRVEAAGYDVLYDDLIVDRVEGVEAKAQLVSTEREYSRLIWDYADGSPKVALHCWRNSLVLDKQKRVRVRLFRRPTESLLEQLSSQQQFLLATLCWHESLTVAEAMQSMRYPRILCQDTYTLLKEWGVLETLEGARYQVTTPWLRAVNRYLRRHHLLP